MDEHFWVAICFFVFVILVFKPIRKISSAYLKSASNQIHKTLEDAEYEYAAASKKLEEIKNLHKTMDIKIKSIHEKSEIGTFNLIKMKEKSFNNIISQREEHFYNQLSQEFNKLSEEAYKEIVSKVKKDLFTYYSSRDMDKKNFTKTLLNKA